MNSIEKRIEQLNELKDKTLVSPSKGVSKESYTQLLVYHISVLKEIQKLVEAFDKNDVRYVEEWYKKRSE